MPVQSITASDEKKDDKEISSPLELTEEVEETQENQEEKK